MTETDMTKEELKQALLKVDAKAAEVEEVLTELSGDCSGKSAEDALLKAFGAGGDEMEQIMAALKDQLAGNVMLQTMAALITVGAKAMEIAKFMGVDPEVLKNLPKNSN